MKIAVCLYGQPRGFEIGHSHLSRSLEGHEVDYFFHLWYDQSEEGKPLKIYSTKNQSVTDVIKKDTDKKILDLYKPRDFIFEKQIEFPPDEELDKNAGRPLKSTQPSSIFQSMLYSRHQSGELMSKYMNEYDIAIATRTDIAPTAKFVDNITDDSIYDGYTRGNEWHDTCLNGCIVASSPPNVKHFLSLYKHYKDIFKKGIDHCDHRMSFYHMKSLDKKFKKILNNNWFFVRNNQLVAGFF